MAHPARLDLFPTRAEWILARDAGEGAPLPDRAGPDHATAPLRRALLGALRGDLLGRVTVAAPDPDAFAAWLGALAGGGWGFLQSGIDAVVEVILPPATACYVRPPGRAGAPVNVQISPDAPIVRASVRLGLPGPQGRACSLVLRDGAELALASAWRVSW